MSDIKIAFGHQARVGKDTACEYLLRKHGGVIYHFSDPLYDILHYAQRVCGFPEAKDVKFLQWIGTEWARAQKENVWADKVVDWIKLNPNGPHLVGDLRFPNEAKVLKDNGFLLVKIQRADRPIDRNKSHPSEIALADFDGWDVVIDNNGSLEELYQKLNLLLLKK